MSRGAVHECCDVPQTIHPPMVLLLQVPLAALFETAVPPSTHMHWQALRSLD